MSNKSVTSGPKPGPYRKTKATKVVNPLFKPKKEWTKIPSRADLLPGRREV